MAVKKARGRKTAKVHNATEGKQRTTISVHKATRDKLNKMKAALAKKTGEEQSVDTTIWYLIKLATSRKARSK